MRRCSSVLSGFGDFEQFLIRSDLERLNGVLRAKAFVNSRFSDGPLMRPKKNSQV